MFLDSQGMQTLRIGSSSDLVASWQAYLRGLGLFEGEATGNFNTETAEATKAFQRSHGLTADGIAGNGTLGKAMTEGFLAVEDDDIYESSGTVPLASPSWPAKPDGAAPATKDQRKKMFGDFAFTPTPTPGNPEGIRILGTWVQDNIVSVEIPQLVGILGAPADGKVLFHRAAADQLKALFAVWEKAGLMHHVLSWAGSWAPRFIRGSRTSLSNHAWATAFDVNAQWNSLGARPALAGSKGSVRELVLLAYQYGFFWGGWYGPGPTGVTRPDGMHFEVYKLLTTEELETLSAAAP